MSTQVRTHFYTHMSAHVHTRVYTHVCSVWIPMPEGAASAGQPTLFRPTPLGPTLLSANATYAEGNRLCRSANTT